METHHQQEHHHHAGHKVSAKRKNLKLFAAIGIVLLILIAGFFVFKYFSITKIKPNSYLIENNYYGFKLQTPKNWIAEKNTVYPDNSIARILAQCKNDKSGKSPVYEIGAFRFKDQRYSQDFGLSAISMAGQLTGAVLEITVNCIPDNVAGNYYGDLKIGGEKAFEEFINFPVFGNTKYISLLHNNLQYRITEYVYVSPADKANEQKIRESYASVFDKIMASLNFTK